MEHRTSLTSAERAGYVAGALLFASGLIHMAILIATGGSWDGPLSFRKPVTFGLSLVLTLALCGAMAAGGLMIARGMTLAADGQASTAYHAGGFLKPVHGVLMHGILVLPAIAGIAARAGWNEAQRIRLVQAVVVGYAAAVAVVTNVAMAGLI